MTHPIHSADAERALPPLPRRTAIYPDSDERCYALAFTADQMAAYVQADRLAAAQVGANGAADIWSWEQRVAADPKDYAERTAMLDEIAELRAYCARLAAGAPAETPKPFAWAYRTIGKGDWRATMDKDWATCIAGMECKPLFATPAATIGAGEGKDALDADPATKQGKLLALADRIDHEKLWRLAGMDHHKLTSDQKDRMNAGVALRRYADIWAPGHWVVVPPVGGIQFGASTLDKAVEMAKRDDVRRAAMRSKTSPGEAG